MSKSRRKHRHSILTPFYRGDQRARISVTTTSCRSARRCGESPLRRPFRPVKHFFADFFQIALSGPENRRFTACEEALR